MTTTLVLDGLTVPIERAGTSRRARLTIERDGSLRLRAADDVGTEELNAFLRSKRQWIYTKLAEKEQLQAKPVAKELVDGEGFLYLGRSHQLRASSTTAKAPFASIVAAWYCRSISSALRGTT